MTFNEDSILETQTRAFIAHLKDGNHGEAYRIYTANPDVIAYARQIGVVLRGHALDYVENFESSRRLDTLLGASLGEIQ